MARVTPIREHRAFPNSCGICTSARPSPKSLIFCTYKIASHPHIPQQLKAARLHEFAKRSHLTPAVSADPRLPGRGACPAKPWRRRERSAVADESKGHPTFRVCNSLCPAKGVRYATDRPCCPFSLLFFRPLYFQYVTHSVWRNPFPFNRFRIPRGRGFPISIPSLFNNLRATFIKPNAWNH